MRIATSFSRLHRWIGLPGWALLAAALLGPASLPAQTAPPKYNRKLADVELIPSVSDTNGQFDLRFKLQVELFGPHPTKLDLSTLVFIRSAATGELIRDFLFEAPIPGNDVYTCGGLGCPGPCGTVNSHGGVVELTCKDSQTIPGACACTLVCPGSCDDCAIDGAIVAEIHPAPFALPETFVEDDFVTVAPPDRKPRYDRSVVIQYVQPSESGPPGTYDVQGNIFVQTFADDPNPLDLSTRILFQDESLSTVHQVDVPISIVSPSAGQCEPAGCPKNCGHAIVDGSGLTMSCTELEQTPFGCGCTIRKPITCKGVALGKSVVLEVEAAPGSLPETYALNNRDWRSTPRITAHVPYDRYLSKVELSDVPGKPGKRRFVASVAAVVYEAHRETLDLSSVLVVHDSVGAVLDEITISMFAEGQDAFTCAGLGCPGPCGTGIACGETVQMVCRDSRWFPECGCTLICDTSCQELDCVFDGDLVFELLPAGGALPELDVRGDVTCCVLGEACAPPETQTVYWNGLEHEALGRARFERDAKTLTVADLDDGDADGFAVRFPAADAFGLEWSPPARDPGDAVELSFSALASASGPSLRAWRKTLVVSRDPRSRRFAIELSGETAGKAGYEVDYFLGDRLVHTAASGKPPVETVNDLVWPVAVRECAILWCTNGGCYELAFEAPTEFDVETLKSLKADRLRFRPKSPFAPPKAFQGLALTANGLPSLRLTAEELHAASSPAREFQRGNVNAVGGVDISDGVRLLGFLFQGVSAPPCMDAADTNDNGKVDMSDAVGIFTFLFLGGSSPPAPGPFACGVDPTDDELSCESFQLCEP